LFGAKGETASPKGLAVLFRDPRQARVATSRRWDGRE
jgi:hypothetical protein